MNEVRDRRNLSLMTDLYQLNMAYAHFQAGTHHRMAAFDLFFRSLPFSGGYALACGLPSVVDYIENLRFTARELDYLKSLNLYDSDFLAYLQAFRFTGDLYAMPEGTVVFPHQPLLTVEAPILEGHLLETALLNLINFQTLIATKAARVAWAAGTDAVLEFGVRRAHGPDAGTLGARAAIIGGCAATSNVEAGRRFGLALAGTHSHAWVQSFPSELAAFRTYARAFPDTCVLLVDTYDTLRTGVPNAVTVFRELTQRGHQPAGIRLDSGDLAHLSKEARRMLDEAGFAEATIVASGDLDEHLIQNLKLQGARIDRWGVGTRLITGQEDAALGGVFKLVAVQRNTPTGGKAATVWRPSLKISDNPEKMTNPGRKKVTRILKLPEKKAAGDLIQLRHEKVDETQPLTLFDPVHTWRRKVVREFQAVDLLVPIFRRGERVYEIPTLESTLAHRAESMGHFWEEYKRLINPERYPVDLSEALWDMKRSLIDQMRVAAGLAD